MAITYLVEKASEYGSGTPKVCVLIYVMDRCVEVTISSGDEETVTVESEGVGKSVTCGEDPIELKIHRALSVIARCLTDTSKDRMAFIKEAFQEMDLDLIRRLQDGHAKAWPISLVNSFYHDSHSRTYSLRGGAIDPPGWYQRMLAPIDGNFMTNEVNFVKGGRLDAAMEAWVAETSLVEITIDVARHKAEALTLEIKDIIASHGAKISREVCK